MADYDVVIVGAGPVGAILSRVLGEVSSPRPLRVLVLESGPATGRTWAEYQGNHEHYLGSTIKVPNTPWVSSATRRPDVLDIRQLTPQPAGRQRLLRPVRAAPVRQRLRPGAGRHDAALAGD